MKILKRIGVAVALLLVLLVGVGVVLPDTNHVERSIDIAAPACTVYSQVDNFKAINAWSPWVKLDPNTQYTYEGPSAGAGSVMHWTSPSKKVGSGSQKITVATPCKEVDSDLDFGQGGLTRAPMTIMPNANGVTVTWSLDSSFGWNLMGRYFGLMMDHMIGPDYEEGLANLKRVAEALPKADFANLKVDPAEISGTTIALVSRQSGVDPMAYATALAGAYHDINAWMAKNHLVETGPPVAIFQKWDGANASFDAGIPVAVSAASPPVEEGGVKMGLTPSGKGLNVVHTGPLADLAATHDQLLAYMAAHGLEASSPVWEEYVSDPATTPADQIVTNLYVLVK